MDAPKHARKDPKVKRDEALALRAQAPIAAFLEDCLQYFARLSAVLKASRPEIDTTWRVADDCLSRLATWGHESGAASGALDRTLQFSSELRETTLEFLSDLSLTLQEAVENITLQLEKDLDNPPPNDSNTDCQDAEQDEGIEDPESYSPAQSLEDAADIVLCLVHLLPSLNDPSTDSTELSARPGDKGLSSTHVTTARFRKAPVYLIRRLRLASMKRRQQLKLARQGNSRIRSARKVDQRGQSGLVRTSRSTKYTAGWVSEAGFSMAPSTAITDLTAFTMATRATSITDNDSLWDFESNNITPPEPYPSVEAGQQPTCPFCGLEVDPVVQGKTTEEWHKHVYRDLQPYLCTFERCETSHRTYASKEEWFQHELERHRMKEVWFCGQPSCRIELATEEQFEKHITSMHKDTSPFQISILKRTCKRYPLRLPPPSSPCPFCGYTSGDIQALKDHLGHHLEQYALEIACSDSQSESSEDDNFSHGAISRADSLVVDFLADQAVRVGLSEANLNHVSDLSDKERTRGRLAALDIEDARSDWKGSQDSVRTSNIHGDQNDDRVRTEKSTTQILRSNGPMPHAGFVGRQQELNEIQGHLSDPGSLCLLSGPGGVGKTAIATEFSYQFGHMYEYIFWVDAETVGGCAESYNLIAKLFDLGDRVRDSDSLAILVREYLSRLEKRWLLVFDNVEKWSSITRYIPSNLSRSSASILVTARQSNILPHSWDSSGRVPIESLQLEDARYMLLHSLEPNISPQNLASHPDFEAAGRAAVAVERLPLALCMVAGFAKVSRESLSYFLELWNETETANLTSSSPIDTIWDIGIQELPSESQKLLDILSFFDPDVIPHDLLVGDHKEPALQFLSASQPLKFQRLLDQLRGRSLVFVKEKAGQKVLSMHRIVQEKIQLGLEPQKYHKTFQRALTLLRRVYPTASVVQVPDLPNWEDCKRYTPHVLSLHRAFKAASTIKPSFELAELLYNAGFGIWACQMAASDGIQLLETAENILNTLDKGEHLKLRGDIYSTLGSLLELTGASGREDSFRRRNQALAIREKIFHDDTSHKVHHILLQNAANDYATSLLEKNQFEEAGEIFDRCFQIYRGWDSEEVIPFEYAKYHHNISSVMMARGNYDEATKSVRHAIQLTEGFSGKGWRYWQFQFTLACIFMQAGDSAAALDLHLEVLSGRKELYGNYDRSTNVSRYAVGATYHRLGDLPTATDYLKECVEYSSVSNCPEEAVARARFHLSALYGEQGMEEEESTVLRQKALETLMKYRPDLPENDKLMSLFDNLQPMFSGRFTDLRSADEP